MGTLPTKETTLSAQTVAVRGTGSIGMRHIRALQAIGHRVVAIPVREGRAADLASQGIESVTSFDEAASRGATAAIIASDTARHLTDAIQAIDAGCDVLVEKPLTPSLAGVADLVRRAESAQRRIFVAYCLRFDTGLQQFRARLAEIGVCHFVRITCQSFLPDWRPGTDYRAAYSARANEGGVLRDLSHEIDYAVWLFGRPARVMATLSSMSRLGIAADETADLWWQTQRADRVSIRLDYLTRTARRGILAQGTNGEIEWDAVAGTVRVARHGSTPEILSASPDRDGIMQRQALAFLIARTGIPVEELCTLNEAAEVVAICDAARRSSDARREETIE